MRKLRLEQEQACDDYVIREGTEHCDYAELLLEIAGSLSGKNYLRIFALSMARKSGIKDRIEHILSTKVSRNMCHLNFIIFSVIMLTALLLPLTVVLTLSFWPVRLSSRIRSAGWPMPKRHAIRVILLHQLSRLKIANHNWNLTALARTGASCPPQSLSSSLAIRSAY